MSYLIVALGGGIGAALRYALSRGLAPLFPAFPAGTLLANVLAGLICGAVSAAHREFGVASPSVHLLLTTGMMGGLSTFSTFSVETVDLARASRYLAAGLNVFASLALCLGGVCLSYWLVRKTLGS
ncbi:MAG: fluoride efflux transporter CrcB [Deltaproteobacteria bacterium]|jgi:CrcB protein|nr:fluoride efflux transporter CrcB [Deltaproteobacteria bacterium]